MSKPSPYPNTSFIQIEGANTQEEVTQYERKRKAKTKKNRSHDRCIWGNFTRPHGNNSGVVREKFTSNLPPKSMGKRVRSFHCHNHACTDLSVVRIVVFVIALIITLGSAQTTQSSDGENIDCVDKMKQPAFENPLLKNHIFQERPSEIPKVIETYQTSKRKTTEVHVSSAKCPEGTVPIRSRNIRVNQEEPNDASYHPGHEYAIVSTTKTTTKIHGTKAVINVWKSAIQEGTQEMSISQIWLASGAYETGDLNTIEVGSQVLPKLYNDSKPRLFLFWTGNAYRTGCYNVQCSGFIQTSTSVVIGGAITSFSHYGGSQFEITIQVWKDRKYGNWWLSLGPNNIPVGYWPAEIFTTLADHASYVQWGGEILDTHRFGEHTRTQMGSGRFPEEGFRRSSYFRNLDIVDINGSLQSVQELTRITSNPTFYSVKDLYTEDWKTHFFYGGPEYRPKHSGSVPLSFGLAYFLFLFSFFLIV